MADDNKNPIMKLILEIGPIIIFFLAYRWAPVPEGVSEEQRQLAQILFATKVFIPTILASLAASWFLMGELPKMAIVTAVIVIVFGGLTLWLKDPTFIKMKPTILYLTFAGILGFGLMRHTSYLKVVMGYMLPLKDQGWMILTKRFALFFLGMAFINELARYNLTTTQWVNFKTFLLPIASFIFMMAQTKLLSTYSDEDVDKKS